MYSIYIHTIYIYYIYIYILYIYYIYTDTCIVGFCVQVFSKNPHLEESGKQHLSCRRVRPSFVAPHHHAARGPHGARLQGHSLLPPGIT